MEQQGTHHYDYTDRVSRISWGSILAGGLAALAISLLLNLLGVGLGFSFIDPLGESNPLDGIGTGTIIWWFISNIIALFTGGFIAGRMAGFPAKADGGLHGFLAWGVYALATLFLVTTVIGSTIAGLAGVTSSIFGGNDQKEVVVQLNQGETQSQSQSGFSFNNIKSEALELINKAEQYNILPSDASSETRSALNQGIANARQTLRDLNLDRNIDEFFNDISFNISENGNLQVDVAGDGNFLKTQELKDYLTANTELSDEELNGFIEKWENNIETAFNKAEEIYKEAKQKAIAYSDALADAIAKICIIAFFVFLLGAIAAYFGGFVGSPAHTVVDDERAV